MTPDLIHLAITLITAFSLSSWAVGAVLRRLTLDYPNDRSSHTIPTPRGGGLGVIPAAWLTWMLFADFRPWPLLAGALILMAGSWIDDRRGLSPLTRLIGQAAMVGWFITSQPVGWTVACGLGLVLVWFVNLYNFMDGIDGITGIETACLGSGIAIVAAISGSSPHLILPALSLTGAALGFLVWNWHPAKVFLGDAGSIPLGFLLGGLLIILGLAGQWQAALILPAYYLADAGLTLSYRLVRREKVWHAHRKHFYQRANRGGAGPRRVTTAILVGNLGLMLCAVCAALGQGTLGLIGGFVVVTSLLALLQWWGRNAPA